MVKRVIIAGCRNYNNYDVAKVCIEYYLSNIQKENGLKVEKYPANWEKYGKSAGPKRNEEMANKCDYVICFWDGKSKGTKSMIDFAKKYKKPIRIIKI